MSVSPLPAGSVALQPVKLAADESTLGLDNPDLRERMPGDLKLVILGLPADPVNLGFLPVYPQVEGMQRHPHGFAVRLRVREAVQ